MKTAPLVVAMKHELEVPSGWGKGTAGRGDSPCESVRTPQFRAQTAGGSGVGGIGGGRTPRALCAGLSVRALSRRQWERWKASERGRPHPSVMQWKADGKKEQS